MESIVMNNITQKTKVVTCPSCQREYFDKTEKDFIKDFGECLGCDKQYSNAQEGFVDDYVEDYA